MVCKKFVILILLLTQHPLKMLSGICFRQIKDNFWLGQYGDFQVVMMQDSSYVNASKLCKDDGKKFKHWLENAASKRLIKALEFHLGHQASDSTLGESSLTGEDLPPGIPRALKLVQAGHVHQDGALFSGT